MGPLPAAQSASYTNGVDPVDHLSGRKESDADA